MSILETNVGIICACMPAMQLLLRNIAPRLFGSTVHNESYAPPTNPSRSRTYRSFNNQVQPCYTNTRSMTHDTIAVSKDTDSENELVQIRSIGSAEGISLAATASTVEATP